MQILQWLSKTSQEPPKELSKKDKKPTKNTTQVIVFIESGVKRKHNKTIEQSKLYCENLNLFGFLQRKDVPKAYFYHTLNLEKLRSFSRKSRHSPLDSMKVTKREDSAKVLPITDSSHSPSSRNNDDVDQRSVKDYENERPKTKKVSKMKELVRWASGKKPEKRGKFGKNVLNLKNKSATKNASNDDGDDQLSISESPKISFTWESETVVASCYSRKNEERINPSTHLHVNDGAECEAKLGNWITTDSEFVVLEL